MDGIPIYTLTRVLDGGRLNGRRTNLTPSSLVVRFGLNHNDAKEPGAVGVHGATGRYT